MRIGIIAAATVAVVMAGTAMANPGVQQRQALMKDIGGNTKAIGAFVKGQSDESTDAIAERAAAIKADSAKIGGYFQDQTHVENAGDLKTTASPAIWEKWDDFVKIAADLEAAAGMVQQAAAAGDKDAVASAFGAMTKNCGACHKPFRVKK